MRAKALVVFATVLSFSAIAGVSFEEKLDRVNELEALPLSENFNVEAYRRDLSYERQGLNFETRAKVEANLLASKMRTQIVEAYSAALEDTHDARLATEEVKKAILKDLELAAPELKTELTQLSLAILEDIERGTSTEINLKSTQNYLLEGVKDRSEFLNSESGLVLKSIESDKNKKPADKYEYDTKQEILQELVGEGSGKFASGASVDVRTNVQTSNSADISLQVKMEFLGVSVEAGPQISFKRDYSSVAVLSGEGLTPFLLPDGNFDIWKRDSKGKIVKQGGKEVRRNISVGCNVDLKFTTNYSGGGGFKVAGVGGGVKFARTYTNSVNLGSRRIALPEYVAGRSVTMKYLSDLCHADFINSKISHSMTVKQSLNVMMKNVVAGLTFSHPETKCGEDAHCYDWFGTNVISLAKIKNFPRCVEGREKIRSCQLRGLKGQNCAVIEKGKRTSDGMFEFQCDVGLKCVKTRSAGWFQNYEIYEHAKGSCQPINPKTYREPMYIEINFVR